MFPVIGADHFVQIKSEGISAYNIYNKNAMYSVRFPYEFQFVNTVYKFSKHRPVMHGFK